MILFSLPLLRIFDPLLTNRAIRFFFWVVIFVVVSLFGYKIIVSQGALESMELALLDVKLRYRAHKMPGDHPAPSKDIVILGIDRYSNQYIREHPELGLNSLTLPREKMSKILEYLTQQGARAVVFDLEFKDPREGDTVLAEAMRRHPHVYAANRIESTLGQFINAQVQSQSGLSAQDRAIYQEKLLFVSLLYPYLSRQSELANRFMPFDGVGLLELGLGPVFHPLQIEDALAPHIRRLDMLQKQNKHWQSPSPYVRRAPAMPVSLDNLSEQIYSPLCTDEAYVDNHRAAPEFLKLLDGAGLPLTLEKPLPPNVERAITYCYTYPTVPKLMSSMTDIGIPSIDYYHDAYIRSASVLYKGYRGNFYTYLGIRPALALLGADTLLYTPEALYFTGKRVPLVDGQKVIINWREPRLMVAQILKEHGFDVENDPAVMRTLDNVKAEKNNPILGDGHIYRQIPIIPILRKIEGETLSPDEEDYLYNVPQMPQTGLFSFKNKIVIIGNTVSDIHRTPLSTTMYGPEVVAAVLDMMLHDTNFIEKPQPYIQWSITGLLALGIIAAIISFTNLSIGFTVGIVLITFYWLINLLSFVSFGWWFDVLPPTLLLGFAQISATLYRYYVHDREKHHLTNVFSKYVSPQIMAEIVKNPEHALENLKGGKKELTVLFSDLQGFTHQFESADPEQMVSQLNEYFDVMTEIILNHGGTYDKYMGDSIMAFFGAPTAVPDHAEMACRAALEMQRALRYLNDGWAREGKKILAHGIGISSGEMFVGNFGSRNIKNFTVMGSNVNLGARLEAYTRIARWPVILSERTWELAKNRIRVRDLGKIQVKGFSETVQVYGLESLNKTIGASNEPGQAPSASSQQEEAAS